jgi:predicted small secreted protein
MRRILPSAALIALLSLSACKTASSAADEVKSAGSAVAAGVSSVPALVNVNLSNVLNNLALDLKVDKANIPINAQIPINVAANVCGVSINVLSVGAGGGSSSGCTANSVSPELKQYIQEQLAANGSVGGGAQTTTGAPASTPTTQPPPTSTTPQPDQVTTPHI